MLVLGDFHIPHRAAEVHEQFRKILVPNKMQHVLCTGNLTSREQVDYLRSLAPKVHIVRGDFDDDGAWPLCMFIYCLWLVMGCVGRVAPPPTPSQPAETLPESKVVTIGSYKLGLMHGHQVAPVGEPEALAAVQRQLDVDVLVTGHTHHHSVVEFEGKCYLNPGSITGAFSPTAAVGEVTPSFMLMNVTDAKIEFYLYELLPGDKLKISRSMYSKPGSGAAAGGAGSGAGAAGAAAAAAAAASTAATTL